MIYLKILHVWLICFGGLLFQQPYSEGWDKKLNQMMDENKTVEYGYLTVCIDGIEVWVSNRWYSYAHPHGSKNKLPAVRPSIKTMIRFSKYIDNKAFK